MKKIFKIMLITTILMTLLLSLPANVFSGELGDGLGELGISYDKKWSSLGDDLPARESYVVGDVNVDEKVSIKDVTLIQKFLADIESMTYNGYYNADVDNDGKLTITDATCIQKKLAGIIDRFPLEEVLYPVKNLSLNKSEAMHVTVGYEGTFIFNCEKEGIYRLKISDDDCMIILYNEQGEALRAIS
ncbi:MAG: dockerin type I repeat-containing protein, partial [Ruminococcus sp.]|nr:dockerin type I repeat-containing protein [Ruminococcus sp.]